MQMVSMELTVFDGSNLEAAQLFHLHLKKRKPRKKESVTRAQNFCHFFFRTYVATFVPITELVWQDSQIKDIFVSAKLVRDLPDNTAKKVKMKREIFFWFYLFRNISASKSVAFNGVLRFIYLQIVRIYQLVI